MSNTSSCQIILREKKEVPFELMKRCSTNMRSHLRFQYFIHDLWSYLETDYTQVDNRSSSPVFYEKPGIPELPDEIVSNEARRVKFSHAPIRVRWKDSVQIYMGLLSRSIRHIPQVNTTDETRILIRLQPQPSMNWKRELKKWMFSQSKWKKDLMDLG